MTTGYTGTFACDTGYELASGLQFVCPANDGAASFNKQPCSALKCNTLQAPGSIHGGSTHGESSTNSSREPSRKASRRGSSKTAASSRSLLRAGTTRLSSIFRGAEQTVSGHERQQSCVAQESERTTAPEVSARGANSTPHDDAPDSAVKRQTTVRFCDATH